MNALARSLGAKDTVAGDPTGLDSPGQFTTVRDLAVLGRAALNDPTVRGYLTIPRASLAGRGDDRFEIQNHNTLLGSYDGTIGVKNGYTVAAGATFVGAATRGGRTLIVSLLRTAPAYGVDARALLDWGFANAAMVTPVGHLPALVEPGAGGVSDAAGGGAPADRAGNGAQSGPDGASSSKHYGFRVSAPLGEIGVVTWAALGFTLVACVVTILAHRARRRNRRRAQARLRAAQRASGRPPFPRDGHVSVTPRPARRGRDAWNQAGRDQPDLFGTPEGTPRRRVPRSRDHAGDVISGVFPAGSDDPDDPDPGWEPEPREASGSGDPFGR
jgi:D-alanyl-D-alanine carboxypeptidase (penicillin-binding protein 5/6)